MLQHNHCYLTVKEEVCPYVYVSLFLFFFLDKRSSNRLHLVGVFLGTQGSVVLSVK